jgi:alkylated DNA repair dioxygenase AlkB
VVQQQLSLETRNEKPFDIPGFCLKLDYITRAEEKELLQEVEAGKWDSEWKRRVQRYGIGYGSREGRVVSAFFPEWLVPIAGKVAEDAGFERFPDNCVINEYQPGQGIAPHKDYSSFGPRVACVSLGSGVLLDFYSEDRRVKRSILIPSRSFWVISGDARSKWLHGIAPRRFDPIEGEKRERGRRVSITFRLKRD